MQVSFKLFLNSIWKWELAQLEVSWKAATQRLTSQFLSFPPFWETPSIRVSEYPTALGRKGGKCRAHNGLEMLLNCAKHI